VKICLLILKKLLRFQFNDHPIKKAELPGRQNNSVTSAARLSQFNVLRPGGFASCCRQQFALIEG